MAVLVIASCTKNEIQEDGSISAPAITASIHSDSPGVKTSIYVDQEGVGTIFWQPGDRVNIFFGTTSVPYTSTNTEPATTVVFNTTAMIGSTESASTNRWGLYPYDEEATCDGSSVITTIPSVQYAVSETFDNETFTMLGHSADNLITFYNVCGGIKFSFSRDDIEKITFKGNNNEDLAGKVKLEMDDEGRPKATVVEGQKTITLTPKTGTTFASGTNYYIITLPVVLSSGFTMTFETATEIGTFNYTEKAVTVARSKFGKKAEIDSYATFVPYQPNNVILYTTTDGKPMTGFSRGSFDAVLLSNTYENGIGELTFASEITEMGKNAIYESRLETISLPQSLVKVDAYSFGATDGYAISIKMFCGKYASDDGRCLIKDGQLILFASSGLTSYITPSSITSIGEGAFSYAFYGHEHTSLIISEGVKNIKKRALTSQYIKYIKLPNSLETIEEDAFKYTSSYPITIPANVTTLDTRVFERQIVEITSKTPATLLGKRGIDGYWRTQYSSCKFIIVPEGTLEAYRQAWPDYAYKIIEKTGLQPLNEIWYSTTDGKKVDISNSYSEWEQAIVSHEYGKIVFDVPVTKIPSEKFYGNKTLLSVALPASVILLGGNCFDSCTNLKNVTLSECLFEIPYRAFGDCKSLESIIIPNFIVHMNGSFQGCSSLSMVMLPESLERLGSSSVNTYGGGVFSYCESLTMIQLPSNLKYLGNMNFDGTGITTITIPNNCEISSSALYGAGKLTSVSFPDSMIKIPDYMFSSCKSLKTLTIPSTVTEIGDDAFIYCDSLTDVVLNSNITKIGSWAFAYCNSLEKVTFLPDKLSQISDFLFYSCNSLTEVTIPENVTIIGREAFSYCKSLSIIHARPLSAPSLPSSYQPFSGISNSGILYHPEGSDYSNWLSQINGYTGKWITQEE